MKNGPSKQDTVSLEMFIKLWLKAKSRICNCTQLYRPNFPKKKIFGITNESPEDIEKRREQL